MIASKIIKLAFFILLALLPCRLFAQDEKEKKTEISLEAKEFYSLQQAYRQDKKTIFAPQKEKLLAILKQNIADAENLYNEKKKSGNMRGMGIARKAKSIFTKALNDLNKNDDFTLPNKVRKELRKTIKECKLEKEKIMQEVADKFVELNKKYLQNFEEQYKTFFEEGQIPDKAIIATKFKEFLASDIPKPKEEEIQQKNIDELKKLGIEIPQKEEKALTPIIASKGTGSKWVDIAQWNGDMMGMDVVTVSVLNKSKDFTETQYFPINDMDSKLFYKAITPMPSNEFYAFRLKRVPGTKDVEIMEWPSVQNDWSLVFRTRSTQDGILPIKHAFIFQVSLPEVELKKLFGKNAIKNGAIGNNNKGTTENKIKSVKNSKVKIAIYSKPKGASIYINGKLRRSKRGSTVVTPCKILVPINGQITLKYLGFKNKIIENFKPKKGAVLKIILIKDDSLKVYKKTINANAKTWTNIGIAFKAGDIVTIKVGGVWRCTKSTKAKCGPSGIPNNVKNYKYYADATKDQRKDTNIPYGALLMRLGEDGSVKYISRKTTLTIQKDTEMFFDINEREGKSRKGNKGKLNLSITVKKNSI